MGRVAAAGTWQTLPDDPLAPTVARVVVGAPSSQDVRKLSTVGADTSYGMPDHPAGYTQQGLDEWYRRGQADGYAGRPRTAATSNWGYLDRYTDGYEDGEFARYREARDAETPLGRCEAADGSETTRPGRRPTRRPDDAKAKRASRGAVRLGGRVDHSGSQAAQAEVPLVAATAMEASVGSNSSVSSPARGVSTWVIPAGAGLRHTSC